MSFSTMKTLAKTATAATVGAALCLSLAACGNKASSAKSSDTQTLELQFVPTNNDGSMQAKAKPFGDYLSKKLDRKVHVTLATDYTTIVEAMKSGKVDIGIMPPAAYVQARQAKAAKAILTSELGAYDRTTGKPIEGKLRDSFKGEVLVRADSSIHSLTDLKGKKIATLSPASASGYIYPVAEMKKAGVDPTTASTLTTVNDIPSAMTAVLEGQQDACFVFEGARNVFASKFSDKDLFKDLRVLYLTKGDIPNDAIAVNPSMDASLQDKVKQAFLGMPKDKEGAEAMAMWGHKGYVPANEKNYDTIEQYLKLAAD
ncbi:MULTISPECIES: phosphate/phosphite/phosphonate ABC transporter substrate-binding protein [Bifidobacterium]|jgi:phosphonate transport system substrate-binding protein|nr:phosphate/phosphite/phosphonate ABC transporter substrate-binding protein [Bifidobacterium tibiigranuli]MCH3975357.1 phosphate/phosphite/phosphonate ABC transporter substrate-binding protein [Bifidobacterium tibiigranuli]MCH4189936.1 phosphate/phosphite/phosphonate ABC transporter substrate-binding protein [Bifidobacterium tibiigranuli]MCH4203556.1 phosphate/phosphite/phosphonate ABC transporter substrate-binding protein [Bifidobacterium tibiigranuli]MCH4273832.1 phosphate/phosphite/phosphon